MKKTYPTRFLRSKSKLFLILLCSIATIFTFQECSISDTDTTNTLNIIRNNGRSIDNDFTGFFLIVPNEGCHPCIDKAWDFTRKNLNKNNFYIVITSDFDFKRTKSKFSRSELSAKNFIIDEKQMCKLADIPYNQVFLIELIKGELISKKPLTPENIRASLQSIKNKI